MRLRLPFEWLLSGLLGLSACGGAQTSVVAVPRPVPRQMPVEIAASGTACGVTLGPWIHQEGQGIARLHWVTSAGAPPASVVAPDGVAVETQQATLADLTDVLHIATLRGLPPATSIEYAIHCADGEIRDRFVSLPVPGSREPLRFVIYGDSRSLPGHHKQVIDSILKDLPISFFVNTGDLIADGRRWPLWGNELFEPARELLRRAAFVPVRGNHEADAVRYTELFGLPKDRTYHSFDVGNVHVVVLDSELDKAPHAAMVAWLDQDLAATKADWKIVLSHRPTFNVGGHGEQWAHADVRPLYEKYGVDLVISGHSHLYERFKPMGAKGGKPITYIVAGGGGAPLYGVEYSPLLEGGIGQTVLHHCVFTVEGDRMEVRVKGVDGAMLDRFELVRGPNAPKVEPIDPDHAVRLLKLFGNLRANLSSLPTEGVPTTVTLESDGLPPTGRVEVATSSAPGGWQVVKPMAADLGGKPLTFQVIPPKGLHVTGDKFDPPLLVAMAVTDGGQRYEGDRVLLNPGHDLARLLLPEPKPVPIPQLGAVTLDGDLGEWRGVASMPLPVEGKASSSVQIGWRPEGLYGAVDVTDDSLVVDERAPWVGDGFELWIEKDQKRALDRTHTPHAAQFVFGPPASGKDGTALAYVVYGDGGTGAGAIASAWKRTAVGYRLEWFIPAAVLAPMPLRAGSRLGLHFALNDDGQPIEQFQVTRATTGFYRRPIVWGVVKLQRGK